MATPERGSSSHWMRPAVLFVFALGTFLSFLGYRALYRKETHAVSEEFMLTSLNAQKSVERELALFFETLNSIGQLHNLSDRIKQADFEEFVEKGMAFQKSILGSYGFAQHIPDELRNSLESERPPESEPFRISELTADGHEITAGRRSNYFPLMYQYPTNGLGLPDGFDFGSQNDFMMAIQQILMTGQQILTAPYLKGDQAAIGLYVFSPIFYSEPNAATPLYLAGFTVGVLQPEQILRRAVPDAQRTALHPQLIRPSADSDLPEKPTVRLAIGLIFDAPIKVADQAWVFECSAQPDYLRRRMSSQPQTVFITGTFISLLLSLLLMVFAQRTRRIEHLVAQRTNDLKIANEKLGTEIKERTRLEYEMLNIASREQQRVGRDLHDSLGQKLTGAVYLSKALIEQLNTNPPDAATTVQRINELLKECVAQLRRVARGLAPVDLSDKNLTQALNYLAQEISSLHGIECRVEASTKDASIPLKDSTHLYHIAQEAINNAVRHGKATRISIRLNRNDERSFKLTIQDNGSGFDAGRTYSEGMGLRIMRYRAEMIEGRVEFQSAGAGQGTVITCTFPIDSSHARS